MSVKISYANITASINPQGAELFSLKNGNTEYIWEGNPEFWGKHSPVLFPIVGTLKDNKYKVNGAEYNLTRHGFARDNEFTVKHQEEN
ncbi:MAG: aldose 1-epimerase family protein, partial [Flavobacterium sp.]